MRGLSGLQTCQYFSKTFDNVWKLRFMNKLPWTTIMRYLEEINDPKLDRLIRRCRSVVGGWSQSNPNNLNRYWYNEYRGGRTPLNEYSDAAMIKHFPMLEEVPSTVALMDLCTR